MIKRILAGLMCAAILLPGGTAARAFDGDAEQDNSVTDAPVENDGAEGENKSETDPAPVTIEITSQPTAKTVTFGAENAVFTVEAVGAEGLSYQWYRAESIDGEGEPIENETGAALVLENPTRADDGAEFYCVVSAYGAASVTSSKAELSVCKKAVTLCLTAAPAGGATYGAEVVLTAKISGAVDGTPAGGTVEFLDDKAALDEASGIAVAENSASYSYVMPVSHGAITARYSGDGNYAEADGELGDYDVQKAAQEALVHPETKTAVYPGAIDVAVTGGSADTDVTYEITDQGAAAAALTDSILTATLAGTFTVKATKPGGDNYNCVSTEYEITIAPKPVNIADTAVNDKVYDGTHSAAFAQTPRFADGGIEPADADDVELVCGTPAFEDVNAADNVTVTFTPFALSGARARNYEIVPPASTAAKIMKRTLTVTAASRTISYGEDIPLKLTVAGFAEGENAETLEDYKSPEVSCEKTKFAASGIYKGAIAVSGGEPTANYKFDYVPGDLTVEAALPVLDTHYTTAAADGKNGWFSKGDFVITPISGTNTSDYDQISVDGEAWFGSLSFTVERALTEVTFYLRDSAMGAQSLKGSASYKIDRTAPSGLGISYSEPLLGKLLSGVTFGYYNPGVVVTLMARDDISGVEYFEWTYTREPDASETISAGSEPARIEAVQSGTDGVYTASFTLTADEAAQYR
ncbi:MAG: YDG domain-containing protein, partial [Oscillospiraceae bacterium]|nr:YDG domain-containing protein [Oscillospiraceae bacterium]